MSQLLIEAATRGDNAQVLEIINAGCDLDTIDARGRTALMAATHANEAGVFKTLIDAGANVDIQDSMQDNPFLYAGAEGLLDILRLANAAGANPRITNRYGGTALIPAAERGHVEVVREILTCTKVDVNHINNLGWTALLEAVILTDGGQKHQEVVRLLLEHGADPMIADREGVTPLQHARARGARAIEEILVAHSTHR